MSLNPVTIFNTGAMLPVSSTSIASFNGISPGTAYFHNPAQQVFADKIATLPQGVSGAARFNQHAAIASALPAEDLHHDAFISDPTLIGSVIIMGVLSGKLSSFFKSLRERAELAIVDLIYPVGKTPEYQKTAAYSLAQSLLPLIQTHQKLMSTGWKWYSGLSTHDKVDVLTRISKGDTDFGPDDVVVTRYPKWIDLRIKSKDGSSLSRTLTLNDLEDRSVSALAKKLFNDIPAKLQRFHWELEWFYDLEDPEKKAVCRKMAEGICEIDTGDDSIDEFKVVHHDVVVVIEHADKSLKVDTSKFPSQRAIKALMKEYDQLVEGLKGTSVVDSRILAQGIAAALLTREMDIPDVVERLIIETSSHGKPVFEDAIRRVVSDRLIERIAQDLEERIS